MMPSLDERIEAAVMPIILRCVPKQYAGDDLEYCVYNYTEIPDSFGDGRPRAVRNQVQVHWLFPWRPGISEDPVVQEKKNALRESLGNVPGFTWPTITPAGDSEWEHLVFEFEALEGVI